MSEFVEVHGKLKWFDPSKGYGFLTDDATEADVLLHVTTLRASGFSSCAFPGTIIHCQAIRRPKGLTVAQVYSVDDRKAVRHDPYYDDKPLPAKPETDWTLVAVKWFNKVRGFGFLTRGPNTPDIFVHETTVRRFGFAELRPGRSLECRYGSGPHGLIAAELRPLANVRSAA